MAYTNPRAKNGNPGGASKPAYAPRGGSQTPQSGGRPGPVGGGSKGNRPDYDVFFAEKGEDGKTRVLEGEDGKWLKAGALWLGDGNKPPYLKIEADIPAGATLSLWAPKNRN